MKYNNHSGNNNSSDPKNNSNNRPDCGMNEIDTETPVVWPSWCYAGNQTCATQIYFAHHFFFSYLSGFLCTKGIGS